jgi:hypothetical protein
VSATTVCEQCEREVAAEVLSEGICRDCWADYRDQENEWWDMQNSRDEDAE